MSAILVIVADKSKPQYALIAVIPTVLFLALDCYYLGFERMFRESYNSFIDKLHEGAIGPADLYVISPSGNRIKECFSALGSFSVWPFYATLLAMVFIGTYLIG